MKTFEEQFVSARSVSTPLIAIRTADHMSTIRSIRRLVGDAPFLEWNCVNGMDGLNDSGNEELARMLHEAGDVERGATPAFTVTLGVLKFALAKESDMIVFAQNAQLQLRDAAPEVIQGLLNLRDPFKASGSLIVLLIGAGDVLPVELQQDVLVIEQPLPTRAELQKIVETMAKDASFTLKPETVTQSVDAVVGLPLFTAEQAVAMELDKEKKTIDIESLWGRKRSIVSQMPGLSFHQGKETLADAAGIESIKKFGRLLMGGDFKPSLILRADELEKQLAGSGTDSSGTKGDLMGEFLTWIEDNKVICSLLLGIPGSSKSWFTYCIGGEYKTPVINYSLSAMQDKHVGVSTSNLRNAQRVVESISDGRIWLIATANSLNGLPPELISRFQVGGIFFFDAPDADERAAIMKLKIAKYKLDASQPLPDTTNWTGRDIENCARKSQLLGCSLVEAGQYVVPLMTSHAEQMDALKQSAHERFLSASHPGVFKHVRKAAAAAAPEGRRIR